MARIADIEKFLSPALREKAETMKRARGLPTLGFYEDLMVHPALFECVENLGTFLRFHGSLPERLREAAILMAAVEQRSAFEWQTHQQTARKAGLSESEIDAIGSAQPLDRDLETVRSIVLATIRNQPAPQSSFDSFASMTSLTAAVELITLSAFYRMMAGLGSAFESTLPNAAPPPWDRRHPAGMP